MLHFQKQHGAAKLAKTVIAGKLQSEISFYNQTWITQIVLY